MISFRNLCVSYGRQNEKRVALNDVSIDIPTGSVAAVIGPSGCGKSTLLKAAAGLIEHDSGSALIDEKPVNPHEQVIGFMPQSYGLMPWKTVRDNIMMAVKIKKRMSSVKREDVDALVQKLGIENLLSLYPAELSGGQQQRVALARVFLLRPDVLLMDEPFSSLDAITREDMQEIFLSLWQDCHVTTIMVTHFVEEAILLGQKIIVLSKSPGRVIAEIDNSLSGNRNAHESEEYMRLAERLHELVRKGRDA